ncbi:MAG: hypothetical protein H0W62_06845 [Chitinophagales bacterium]|nr:hypothetical protein [Chitinophagales bacterium]
MSSLIRPNLITKIILCSFIIFSVNNVPAQNRANIWEIGYQPYVPNVYFDFNHGSIEVNSIDRKLLVELTNASICDTTGNILFYTNGQWIANSIGDSIANGKKFNPGYLTDFYTSGGLLISQAAIAISDPGNSNRYYLFYEKGEKFENIEFGYTDYQPFHLSYSLIDITKDNGLGAIVNGYKNVYAIEDTLMLGMITACKHANGRDWWIVVRRYDSDEFYTVLVSPSGVSAPQMQKIGPVIKPFDEITPGEVVDVDVNDEAQFSPDGNHYAFIVSTFLVHLLDFDRCNGLFTNYRYDSIPLADRGGNATIGCAFSSNSKFLYADSYRRLYQYDITQKDFTVTRSTVGIYDDKLDKPVTIYFAFQQLAPDNKIYMTPFGGSNFYDVINNPNLPDSACNFDQHGLALPTYTSSSNLFKRLLSHQSQSCS